MITVLSSPNLAGSTERILGRRSKASDIGRAFTRDELRQLAAIAATDADWTAAFYGSVLAANTGLRGGEIKKLRIESLDFGTSAVKDPKS